MLTRLRHLPHLFRSATHWICGRCGWQGKFPATVCPTCRGPVSKVDI